MDYNELNGLLNNLQLKDVNVNKLQKESSFKLKDDINNRLNNYKQSFGEINYIQTNNEILPNDTNTHFSSSNVLSKGTINT